MGENTLIFLAFKEWVASLDFDIGEDAGDVEPWWNCFKAGYEAGEKEVTNG